MTSHKTAPSQSRNVYVALLRGINVGGKKRLPMKDLTSIFQEAGCGNVRTYIQSGNVTFEADTDLARRIPTLINESIRRRFAMDVPVVTRTGTELSRIVRSNPFLKAGADESTLAVAFLADQPTTDQIAALDPDRSPPDEFVVSGCEIFLRFPNGLARTKLTNAYFDSALGTMSTVRNWRTTLKLLQMTQR